MGRSLIELKTDIMKELYIKSPIVLTRLRSNIRQPRWPTFMEALNSLVEENKIEIKPHRTRSNAQEVWLKTWNRFRAKR